MVFFISGTNSQRTQLMDFSKPIPDATKKTILTKVIGEMEQEIYELCLRQGIDVSALEADYTAPAEPADSPTGKIREPERRIQFLNERLTKAKSDLTALG